MHNHADQKGLACAIRMKRSTKWLFVAVSSGYVLGGQLCDLMLAALLQEGIRLNPAGVIADLLIFVGGLVTVVWMVRRLRRHAGFFPAFVSLYSCFLFVVNMIEMGMLIYSQGWLKGGDDSNEINQKQNERRQAVFCDVYELREKVHPKSKAAMSMRTEPDSHSRLPVLAHDEFSAFAERKAECPTNEAQYASDLNDVMDEMLNRSDIPPDYGETMVEIFSEKSQGDVIRDFAVQHIGLYAETLQMRGKYDAASRESASLRDALWDAADETRTIVAAAAFRALADMSAFDQHVDSRRLDAKLVSCVADASAAPAARVMAAQLCGERRVVAKLALAAIAADRRESEPLRLAAGSSARSLAE